MSLLFFFFLISKWLLGWRDDHLWKLWSLQWRRVSCWSSRTFNERLPRKAMERPLQWTKALKYLCCTFPFGCLICLKRTWGLSRIIVEATWCPTFTSIFVKIGMYGLDFRCKSDILGIPPKKPRFIHTLLTCFLHFIPSLICTNLLPSCQYSLIFQLINQPNITILFFLQQSLRKGHSQRELHDTFLL